MKKFLLILLTLHLSAGFFETAESRKQVALEEQAKLCQLFTEKAEGYAKNMRNDELAHITLFSYKKRALIYCGDGKFPVEEEIKKTVKPNLPPSKNISLEDERLCTIFKKKVEKYQKNMRDDALAITTLASYKKRAYVFCSAEPLEKKEKAVREEDEQLCKVFKQGPKICDKFDSIIIKEKKDILSDITKESFKKREKLFCSSKPLFQKDQEVYEENQQLCQLYYDNIKVFENNMKENKSAQKTLEALKKRVNYFCADKKMVLNKTK